MAGSMTGTSPPSFTLPSMKKMKMAVWKSTRPTNFFTR
jgi:hypothetical protein